MTTSERDHTGTRHVDWCPAQHEISGTDGGGARGVHRVAEHARLRHECPVAWSEDWGGYWTLARYQDVAATALDDDTFRAGRPFVQVPDMTEMAVIPIAVNPPEHTFYRRFLNPYFTAERVAGLEPAVRRSVVSQLGTVVDRPGADVVTEFCAPVAAQALAYLLNLSDAGCQALLDEMRAMDEVRRAGNCGDAPGEAAANAEFGIIAAGVQRVIAERRAHPLDPAMDLVSGVLTLTVDGNPLPDPIVLGIGVQVFGAGHQTTRDALGSALYFLATNPGDQARLRRDPSLIPGAAEEYLRLDPPLQESVRRATHDVELHERQVLAGESVAMNFASANRDEAQFPHPDACLIDRTPNRHLSFGHGRHKCIGAPLARMEIRVVLEEVLARTRSIELDGVAVPGLASHFGGFSELPLRLTSATRR